MVKCDCMVRKKWQKNLQMQQKWQKEKKLEVQQKKRCFDVSFNIAFALEFYSPSFSIRCFQAPETYCIRGKYLRKYGMHCTHTHTPTHPPFSLPTGMNVLVHLIITRKMGERAHSLYFWSFQNQISEVGGQNNNNRPINLLKVISLSTYYKYTT